MLHRDGSYRWVLTRAVAVRDLAGNAIRIVGSQADITARKSIERRLLRAALHDPLTGLPNRSYFMQQLENAHHRVREHSRLPVRAAVPRSSTASSASTTAWATASAMSC